MSKDRPEPLFSEEVVQAGSVRVPETRALYQFSVALERARLGVGWTLASAFASDGRRIERRDGGYAATRDAALRAAEDAMAVRRHGPVAGAWPPLPAEPDVTLEMIPLFRDQDDSLPRWWRVNRDRPFYLALELALPLAPGGAPVSLAAVLSYGGTFFWYADDGTTSHEATVASLEQAIRAAADCVQSKFLTGHCRARLRRELSDAAKDRAAL